MKTTSSEGLRHYPALDGLRGVAILMVMLHHFLDDHAFQAEIYKTGAHFVWTFWTGVDLFFVLSGFLITRILIGTRGSKGYFSRFYLRRMLRILPLYYLVIASALYLLPMIGMGLESGTSGIAPYYFTFTSNIYSGLHGWTSRQLDLLWSLAVEEQFYLIWPLLIAILSPRRVRVTALACLIFLPAVRYFVAHAGFNEVFNYTMLPTHCDGLLIGALLAALTMKREPWKQHPALAIAISAGTLLFLLLGSFNAFGITISPSEWTLREAVVYYSLLALLFGYQLLLAIGPKNSMQHFYCNPLLQWLGKYSYALYLLHRLCAWVVERAMEQSGINAAMHGTPVILNESLYLLLISAVTLIAARLSWVLLERPFLRLKRYFPYQPAESAVIEHASLAASKAV